MLPPDTNYYVHIVSKLGQLISGFRLTRLHHGVCTLLAARDRAEEFLSDDAKEGVVMIVTVGREARLDQTQRLVLTKVLPANGTSQPAVE